MGAIIISAEAEKEKSTIKERQIIALLNFILWFNRISTRLKEYNNKMKEEVI